MTDGRSIVGLIGLTEEERAAWVAKRETERAAFLAERAAERAKIPRLDYPEDRWDANPDAAGILHGHFILCGVDMHLTAVEIHPHGNGQTAVNEAWEDDLTDLASAFGADGHWEQTTIRGREYVVFAHPFT
jgi:hypothetical protein